MSWIDGFVPYVWRMSWSAVSLAIHIQQSYFSANHAQVNLEQPVLCKSSYVANWKVSENIHCVSTHKVGWLLTLYGKPGTWQQEESTPPLTYTRGIYWTLLTHWPTTDLGHVGGNWNIQGYPKENIQTPHIQYHSSELNLIFWGCAAAVLTVLQ